MYIDHREYEHDDGDLPQRIIPVDEHLGQVRLHETGGHEDDDDQRQDEDQVTKILERADDILHNNCKISIKIATFV